jgi:type II secretory pathway pseudopilin PulG
MMSFIMFCSNCGTQSPEGSFFCPKCGTSLRRTPPPFPRNTEFASPKLAHDLMKRPTVVSVLAVLHFLAAGLYLLGTIGFSFALSTFKEAEPKAPFMIIAAFCAVFMMIHTVTGVGLWKMRPFGRTLQIILAILALISIPIGTIIGIMVLIYMYKPEVKTLFSGKAVNELQPNEINQLSKLQTSGSGAGVVVAVVAVFFIGIALIGIIAAIAIPNLLSAVQRSKQKRTMADMRAIAVACEAYGTDNKAYPNVSSFEELIPKLEPKYLKNVPRLDAWQNGFKYRAWNEDDETEGSGPYHYIIISHGKDGREDSEDYTKETVTSNFNNDIVFSDGIFLVYPEGVQQ